MTEKSSSNLGLLKLILSSVMGFFVFFVSFTFNGANSIFIDHAATLIRQGLGSAVPYFCVALMFAGAIHPFVKKTWNQNLTTIIFTVFKILGAFVGVMYIMKIGPAPLFKPGMLPFLFEKLAVSLSFIIPIGAALIIFLTDYGLMEFIGVFARPFMRPVFKSPGRSAVDAVASFVGSYSIGLLITGQQYKLGRYTKKEAAIVATGFSTVSATFCVVVAKTLGLMEIWNTFFWLTLVITFVVTAITVRIWPLSTQPDEYIEGAETFVEPAIEGGYFKTAVAEGVKAADKSVPVLSNLWNNFVIGLVITMGIVPSIMSVGLLGLVLAEYTPVFDILGYLFYPITALLQFADPHMVAKAASLSIAEMFLPAVLVKDADIITRFVIGVTSISEILFFSASIPCVIMMGIPISIKDIVIIWFERVALTIIITTPVAWMLFG